MLSRFRLVMGITILARPVMAQGTTGPALTQAAATIGARDVQRYLDVLTADSVRDLHTPSPALERTAQYLAAQLGQLGLQPGIQTGTQNRRKLEWLQRYPIPGQQYLDPAEAQVVVQVTIHGQGKPVVTETGLGRTKAFGLSFATGAGFVAEVGLPELPQVVVRCVGWSCDIAAPGSTEVVMIAGRHTVASLQSLDLHDKVVVYLPPLDGDTAVQRQVIAQLYAASRGVILGHEDSAQLPPQPRVPLVDSYLQEAAGAHPWPWAVTVPASTIQRILSLHGLDLAQVRSDTAPLVRELPFTEIRLQPNKVASLLDKADTAHAVATAPNVIGVLEGRDSVLAREYVVIAVPMDAPAGQGNRQDGIDAAVAGNPLTMAGWLALAQAFSRPEARPRRSLILLATSGGADGHTAWGANAFVDKFPARFSQGRIVAALTLDLSGRSLGDTVVVDGSDDVESAVPPAWVVAMHPELAVDVVDGGTAVRPDTPHFPFARAAIPGWYFHTRRAGQPPLDPRQAAQVLRLIFYVAQDLANADRPLAWSAEGRRHRQQYSTAP